MRLKDYPYNTVPNKVEHLFQAQLFHDRSVLERPVFCPGSPR